MSSTPTSATIQPATLLFTISATVAAAQGAMPGMDNSKDGDMDNENRASPKHGGMTTMPNGSRGGGKPAKGGAGSLAPTLLMTIGAAGLAVLVA